MANACSACGEQNAADAQFCSSCRSYLGWEDQDDTQIRLPPVGSTPGSDDPSPTPEKRRQPLPPPPEERDSFEAGIDVTDATVTLDGAPATVTVNVANTSTLVDSYLVDAVDPPSWLKVKAGKAELLPSSSGTVVAELSLVSHGLVPAQQLSVVLRVSNSNGRSTYRDLPVAVSVPVVTAPLVLRAEPRQLRVRDPGPGVCRVVVSNAGTNRWAQIRLSATDPEQVVRTTWSSAQLQVPPGGEESTEVRFEAPLPEPGGEITRTITITVKDGNRTAETAVTLAQSAAEPAIEQLELRLEPSVLRLGGRHRGSLTAMVDNRRGTTPVGVSLTGHDQEKRLGFTISPGSLQVQPGQAATARVTVTAPRTQPGQEVIRAFTIAATDGRADKSVEGRVIQLASSRRGIARIVLTVLGGLLMFLGSITTFVSGTSNSAFNLTAQHIADEVRAQNPSWGIPEHLDGGGTENVASIGLILIILAALVVFGLTGTSGKLTRISALVGLLVVVATFVGSQATAGGSGPAAGAFVAGLGCIVAYVGGLLARR